ncbi:hypothetical protein Ahy_A06g030398 [Arachis hypogaea]|uniref:Ubiquitin-like protease family profile domain-containing protein n=1 Tax=Arachis hypogaea TaxID=3818 RepID=A0A445CW56_ARAHY|nr:hypothetical protein Ahy_A06g030398 [Arachis hypogaea]
MSTRRDPASEATATTLLIMARTSSYVPKELPVSSFSLDLTDSSQEETQTQEGVGQAEAQVIVTVMGLILNQQNIKRFQEEIYCLPPNIVNMAIGNHSNGEFLRPKSKKSFNVEDYPMFIPFLDRKKLTSHSYVADVRKKRFYILDPYHKTCPSKDIMKLNKFITYSFLYSTLFFVFRGYIPGASLKKKDREIEPPYIDISGQKTDYDCAIYVMKWLEIIEPQNVKKEKYEWDNWAQAEVDHFRVEFASRILFMT